MFSIPSTTVTDLFASVTSTIGAILPLALALIALPVTFWIVKQFRGLAPSSRTK
jgi:hypothetical protein